MAHFIDWLLGLLTPAQWDSWRNWLATVGGLVALSIALATYARNVRLKREEAARLVYAAERRTQTYLAGAEFEIELDRNDVMVTDGSVAEYAEMGKKLAVRGIVPFVRSTVVVRNGSKERISPVYAHLFSRSANRRITDSPPIENIDPESDATIEVLFPLPIEGRPEVGTSLVFRDSSGRWWQRHLDGPLRRARSVKNSSVLGVYWQHDPSIEHEAFKQGENAHAVGVFTKNVVPPPRPGRG